MARNTKSDPQATDPADPQQSDPQATGADVVLVRMAKGADAIDVHPSCVGDHERMGWAVE